MLKKPSRFGFMREVVKRPRENTLDEYGEVVEGKQIIDIYYKAEKKRLRSLKEAEKYLSENKPEGLSVQHFTFSKRILGLGEEFEIVRHTGTTVARRTGEKKTSNKIGASRKKLQPAADIKEKKTSDSGNPQIVLHISCEELDKETTIKVKKGKLLKNLMRKFSVKAGLEGPDQLVFLCEGKVLKETDTVDNLTSTKIEVKLAERGN